MKKKAILGTMLAVMSFGLLACGNKATVTETVTETNEAETVAESDTEGDSEASTSGEASESITIPVESNDQSGIRAAYSKLVTNMKSYVADCEQLTQEYITYDYMYFDYDGDEAKEVILYLGYNENDTYFRDVVFMDYFEDRQQVDILAINRYDENDASFYLEYEGMMGRYSWITSPCESYLYLIVVRDGSLMYVLEKGYGEIVSDLDKEGMHPLPLYGDWELLPED